MAEFTMAELLRKHGLAHRVQDTQLTRRVARRLRERGYRCVRKHRAHVWTNEGAPDEREVLAEQIVAALNDNDPKKEAG